MEMDVSRKDMTKFLDIILKHPGFNSNIGHHVLKVRDDKIGPNIQHMAHEIYIYI